MAMSPTQKQDAYKFFIVSFGAVPGVEYMNQIADAYSVGLTTKEIVNIYSTKPQFEAIYPRFLTNEQFADKLIENVVGASATDAAKAQAKTDVVAALNAGWSKGDVVFQIFTNLSNKPVGDADWGKTATMLANKAEVAEYLTETLLVNSLDLEALGAPLKGVTDDAATVQAAKDNGMNNSQTYTLTNDADKATANLFEAGQVYTPGGNDRINSLQNDDVLTGTGDNPTLNVVLGNPGDNGNATITPTLAGIETINARFDATAVGAMNLDLQDASGVKQINVTRVADNTNAFVSNIADKVDGLSIANSNAPNNNISFTFLKQAVAGADDAVALKLSNVDVAGVVVQERGAATEGFETINLTSTGAANSVDQLFAEDLQTLNIAGDTDLTLGSQVQSRGAQGVESIRHGGGLANVAGSLETINAADFEGKLDIVLGAEINAGKDGTSGVPVQFTFTGGKGDDTVRLVDAVVGGAANNTDRLDGGEGNNTLVVTGATTIAAAGTAAAPVANVTNFQKLEVRAGHDNNAVADAVNINAAAFNNLESIYIRNEGQEYGSFIAGVWTPSAIPVANGEWRSVAEGMTVNLTNLTSAQANAITLAHGTTGNSGIANNNVNIGLTGNAAGAADSATVTLVDGVNNNPVFNARIGAAGVEQITLVDNDTESNTVHINQGVFTQAGSSITVTGGAAGQYMNLDSFNGQSGAAGVVNNFANGYGYATDGSAGNNTTVAATAGTLANVPVTVSTSHRDNAVSSVFFGTAGTAVDNVTRHLVENVDASGYAGDFIIRVGDVTRADGVSSMNIKSGAGNDTFIFDAIGSTSAGFTSGDTIVAGEGTDTLVLDGNTATLPGAPRISAQTSEWDNLSGIDVLRFGNNNGVGNVGNGNQVANNGGGYYVRIDNDFVSQTDAGDRLTIINNDGELDINNESDAVVDLRGLSQNKWVTFVGANGVGGAAISSNRIVVDDISANRNMILDGGDTDVRVGANGSWVGFAQGNNNVLEVRNTADVSINDLAQTKNFGRIEFVNDQATVQTLTLALNATVADALADSSHRATATEQETLTLIAGGVAGSLAGAALNVQGRAMGNAFRVNVTTDRFFQPADSIELHNNLGGAAGHTVDMADGAGNDVLSLFGAVGDRFAASTINVNGTVNSAAALAVQNSTGLASVTHNVSWDNGDVIRLVDAANTVTNLLESVGVHLTMIGSNGADTIIGGAGNDTITGGTGADTINAGGGANVITDAGNGNDTIIHNTAGATVAVAVAGVGTVTLTASQAGATTTSAVGINTTVNASTSTAAVTLNGDTGNDVLTGGAGNDTITGGAGNDTIALGGGNNTVVFNSLVGADTVNGYVVANDSIQLSKAAYAGLGAIGALTAAEFESGAGLAAAATAAGRIVYNTTTGDLYYDADGSGAGAAVLLATITGAPALVAGEFSIIA